ALILGLLTRWVALPFIFEFLILSVYVRPFLLNSSFAGTRLEIALCVMAILLATNGAGALSLDKWLFKKN
ncbi:MAG: DoxX family protein, partial [SAR324 cluster bacterium]|nr:DoxX family protein [SAR324 cluster bacterium]